MYFNSRCSVLESCNLYLAYAAVVAGISLLANAFRLSRALVRLTEAVVEANVPEAHVELSSRATGGPENAF